MLLKDLMDHVDPQNAEIQISAVTCDSRKVSPGCLFVCIPGTKIDGHDFALQAERDGAAVIVAERDTGAKTQVIVENCRAAFAEISAKWFGEPAKDLIMIGVTGTNGKTSVTHMLKKILEQNGHKVGMIGTIRHMIGDTVIESHNTTPGAYELNELFARMKAEGCSHVVMEVSSHALDQCRVYRLPFRLAVFTNLTQDHLDYHGTMERYLEAKKKLFSMCETAIINSDDSYAEQLTDGLSCEILTYSTGDSSTFSAKGINYRPACVDYELVGDRLIRHIRVHTGGKFSVYNSMAAGVAAIRLGISPETVATALDTLSGVKGRAEVVPCDRDFTVIIDYAHTPDGLKNILTTFRECPKNRLIVLFGCGGDRDKTKRPIMGSIAVHYADYAIITSDNPRSEEPSAIIDDILVGVDGTRTPYKVIENRAEAIRYAVSIARKDDIVVLAGKGHETYQILKEGTIHLDEREIVAQALKEVSGEEK